MILALLLLAAADAGPAVPQRPDAGVPSAADAGPAARAPDAGPAPQAPDAGQAAPSAAPVAPRAAEVKAPPIVEYALSLRHEEFRVKVTIRPGEPQPNQLVELVFDVGRLKEGEVGEPAPLDELSLALSVSGPGPKARYLVRPLGDAGVYGVHWTPTAKGLWTLSLAPFRGAGPQSTFQVGVGVPMPASAQGHAVQASRVVVASGRQLEAPPATLKQVMDELGQKWLQQSELPRADPAELKAMAALARSLAFRVPRDQAKDGAEFDALAIELSEALEKAPLAQLNGATCLKCHVKFRDGWVQDLSRWPEVKPWKH